MEVYSNYLVGKDCRIFKGRKIVFPILSLDAVRIRTAGVIEI